MKYEISYTAQNIKKKYLLHNTIMGSVLLIIFRSPLSL